MLYLYIIKMHELFSFFFKYYNLLLVIGEYYYVLFIYSANKKVCFFKGKKSYHLFSFSTQELCSSVSTEFPDKPHHLSWYLPMQAITKFKKRKNKRYMKSSFIYLQYLFFLF
jgi:hypothetical protein